MTLGPCMNGRQSREGPVGEPTRTPFGDRSGAPVFSVITVTLNPGGSLGRTVDSVRRQRCRAFEHIIKDGGSTDGSLDGMAGATEDYRPIVVREPDSGIYDAMNQGLRAARGTYVLFLNAGDRLYDDGVLGDVASAVSVDPAPSLVYGDYFDEPLQAVLKSPKRLSNFFLFRNTLCHQACFVRRSVMNALGGFDTSLTVVADYDALIRMRLGLGVSYLHLARPLVSTLGGGFSAQRANAERALREADVLRRRHFPWARRTVYAAVRAATLPRLRFALVRSRSARLKLIYSRIANLWNG